ncbi:MAG: hypothetical protein R3213_05535 [Flavobacteriaceae bacterium]|nr:hypothetical protein [Flavobacteriaceae bacterium]
MRTLTLRKAIRILANNSFSFEELNKIASFAGRIRYCQATLPRIASGSARIIYELGNDKVLKLARNAKGLAQNLNEADHFIQQHYGDIIAKVTDYHQDDWWIVMERAKKVTKGSFKRLLGYSLDDFYDTLLWYWNTRQGKKTWSSPPENKDEIMETEFFNELIDLMANMAIEPGDFSRPSSYGEIDGRLVITDYGLTKDTFDTYYKR